MAKDPLTTVNSLGSSDERATKFLSLYECLSNPEHTELLIETIGNWLGEEDEPLHIESLEQHSQSVLKLAVSMLRDPSGPQTANESPSYTYTLAAHTTIAPADIETELGVSFVAEDIPNFRQWLKGPEGIRLFCTVDQQDRGRLCLASKSLSNPDEPILEFWLNDVALALIAEELLIRDLGVSHSEILVLREIAFGLRRSEIAERLGKSGETIRSQIKSIANKMGVTGQIEIAAELRNLEARVRSAPHQHPDKKSTRKKLILPDGRQLDYLEYGPDNGVPVLYFHCFLHGKHLPDTIEKTLEKVNIRIISMGRAGFGDSSEHPGANGEILDANARDYRALVRNLDLG